MMISFNFILITLFIFFGQRISAEGEDGPQISKSEALCLTKNCVIAAAHILEKADFSVNPCQDFYQYACGRFIQQTSPVEERPLLTQFSKMSDVSHAMVKYIFDEPRKMAEPVSFWKVKDFFHSCMNHRYDKQQLKDMFERFGGWPVWEGTYWRQSMFDWQGLLARLNPNAVVITVQEKGPENFTIEADIPPQTFHLYAKPLTYEEMLRNGSDSSNSSWIEKYERFMVNISLELEAVRPEEEMREVLELMVQLAKEAPYPEASTYQLMTIKELIETIPEMDWLKFFNEIFQDKITDDFKIVAHNPEYLKFVINVLSTIPKRTAANFIIWELIQKVMPMLELSIPAEFEEFDWEEKDKIQRVVKCIEETLSHFSDVAFAMYVRKYLQDEDKTAVQKLHKYLSKEISRYFAEEGLTKAKEKIHSLKVHAGYPEDIHEEKLLETSYGCLSISQRDHIYNLWNLAKFSAEKMIHKQNTFSFHEPWDHTWISGSPYMIHKPGMSHFIIPPTLLRCAIFDNERPQALNFGALGQDMAKILITELSKTSSDSSIRTRKRKLFSPLWKHKNITDDEQEITALDLTYKAFQDWNAVHRDEKTLPSIPLTSNQLFWIAYGNKKCAVSFEKKNLREIEQGRSNGLQNVLLATSDFKKDFNCV